MILCCYSVRDHCPPSFLAKSLEPLTTPCSSTTPQSPPPSPTAERLLGLLVQVGDGDAGGQDSVVGVLGGHGGRGLGSQVVQLDRGHARVEAADHLQHDGRLPGRCGTLLVVAGEMIQWCMWG